MEYFRGMNRDMVIPAAIENNRAHDEHAHIPYLVCLGTSTARPQQPATPLNRLTLDVRNIRTPVTKYDSGKGLHRGLVAHLHSDPLVALRQLISQHVLRLFDLYLMIHAQYVNYSVLAPSAPIPSFHRLSTPLIDSYLSYM
jgi:hypothetical protein